MIDGAVDVTAVGGGSAAVLSIIAFVLRDYFYKRKEESTTTTELHIVATKLNQVISLLKTGTGNTSSIRQSIAIMKKSQERMAKDIENLDKTMSQLRVDIASMGK